MIYTVRVPEANHPVGQTIALCGLSGLAQARGLTTQTDHLSYSPVGFLADLDIQPLDLLVQRTERNAQAFGGFGLAPIALFEPLQDDAPFVVVDNLEERRVGGQRCAFATLHPDAVGRQQRLRE